MSRYEFSLVVVCIVFLSLWAHGLVREPYGPKLCRELCRQMCGCRKYTLLSLHLTCYIGLDQHSQEFEFQLTQIKKNELTAFRNTCPLNTKLITSRMHKLLCVPYKAKEREKSKTKGLLLVPREAPMESSVHLLDERSNCFRSLPFPRLCKVSAIVYVSKSQRFLVSAAQSKTISSLSLNDNQTTILHHGVTCRVMAIDQENQIAFLIIRYQLLQVHSMKPDGTHLTAISKLRRRYQYISVDPMLKLIITSTFNTFTSCSYDGKHVRVVKTLFFPVGFTIDIDSHDIYYAKRKKIIKRSIDFNHTSEIIVLKQKASQMIYYKGDLYLSPIVAGEIRVIKNMTQVGTITADFPSNVLRGIFCIMT